MAKTVKLAGLLVADTIAALPAGDHHDGNGLYLCVTATGSRSWTYRYRSPVTGKHAYMGLGSPAKGTDLQGARAKHVEARAILVKGRCPLTEKREGEAAVMANVKAKASTFQAAAEHWIADVQHTWTNDRHIGQVATSLARYVYPVFGKLPVTAVERRHVIEALRPIWHTKTPTALRVRERIAAVFAHVFANDEAIEKQMMGRNPAALPPVFAALGRHKKVEREHFAAMPHAAMPALMARLRDLDFIGARGLEMTILSCLRTGEVIDGQWSEIDFKQATWTIPAERMKNRKEFTVPLTPRMVEILLDLKGRRENNYIFPGNIAGQPISNMTMIKVLKVTLGEPNMTVHGFRSAFRDWAFEQAKDCTGQRFPSEIAEMCLSHKIGSAVVLSYLRSEGRDLRRELLEAWSAYCASAPAATALPDNVVRLSV